MSSYPKSILVLGGLGFIGSHVSRALLKDGHQVTIFDKLYASHALVADVDNELTIVEGDFTRSHDVLSLIDGIDTIIHLIHTTVPGTSMLDPAYDVESNVASTVRLLEGLKESSVKHILYVSSGGTVYGNPQDTPISESHPTNPISSYGITKLAIEKYITLFADLYGIRATILRPSNVYGPGQQLNTGQGLIGVLIDRIFQGETIEVWGKGTNLRDYLYVEDLVRALIHLLDYDSDYRVFNVSTARGYSIVDIINMLRDSFSKFPDVQFLPARGFDVSANILDNSRLKMTADWEPLVPLQQGISEYAQWAKSVAKPPSSEGNHP